MVGAEQSIPIYVPLIFIAWGLLLAVLNRGAFKDPDGALRRMAESRAKSRVVRLLGGSGDAHHEYEQLRRTRWMFPLIAGLYTLSVLWMLVIAIGQP